MCLLRGEVQIVGLSNGPLRWPIGEKEGKQELVVYRSLADAVVWERPEAVAARWGIPLETVAGWKRTLCPDARQNNDVPVEGNFPSWTSKPAQRQFTLLDLVFWTFWIAVLAALWRLRRADDLTDDRVTLVTICSAASLSLGAIWGHAKTLSADARRFTRLAIVPVAGFLGLLLWEQLSEAQLSIGDHLVLVLVSVPALIVGVKLGMRSVRSSAKPTHEAAT